MTVSTWKVFRVVAVVAISSATSWVHGNNNKPTEKPMFASTAPICEQIVKSDLPPHTKTLALHRFRQVLTDAEWTDLNKHCLIEHYHQLR